MKIRFLFYRASQERKNWVGRAIALWTAILPCNWGSWKYWYSHTEVWFPDENGDFVCHYDNAPSIHGFRGQCFSSTTRGDAEGTRFIPANELLKHPERWDYIECEVKDPFIYKWSKEECQILAKARHKYDFWGLFGFFLPFNVQDSKKWYCSELCALIAWKMYLLSYYQRISPRRLASKLAKKYGEPIRLFAGYAAKGKKK